ncbi:MAG: hypothetical protein QM498_02455 [Desulfobacterium sp.]
MKNDKKKDIMDSILADEDSLDDKAKDLDFLIYQCDKDNSSDKEILLEDQIQESIKVSKGNVSVEIWEGKAKIKVKASPGAGAGIFMERIATIAVDAILETLKKETLR